MVNLHSSRVCPILQNLTQGISYPDSGGGCINNTILVETVSRPRSIYSTIVYLPPLLSAYLCYVLP